MVTVLKNLQLVQLVQLGRYVGVTLAILIFLGLGVLTSLHSQARVSSIRPGVPSCNKIANSGEFKKKFEMNESFYDFIAVYRITPFPLTENPNELFYHIFEYVRLDVNGLPVLISPQACEFLMNLFGYRGLIHFETDYMPAKQAKPYLVLDYNLNVVEANPDYGFLFVKNIYIEERRGRSCL
jgi:hypothetical protein